MSGPAPPIDAAADPALDPGVLDAAPILEFHGWSAVARHGGMAVVPWRRWYLEAMASGCQVTSDVPSGSRFPQSLVRIQRGRVGTEADLAHACAALSPGGSLIVTGANDLGIDGWIKRVQKACAVAPHRVHHRAKARVAVFAIDQRHPYPAPAAGSSTLSGGDPRPLTVAPGVFSGDGIDAGTAILVSHLASVPAAGCVLDLGCGAGHLGIAALERWQSATALMLDADARAVACTQENLQTFVLGTRAQAQWWDASEPVPGSPGSFDCALINPPAHTGTTVSVGAAQQMFRRAGEAVGVGGRLVIVANRRLPYENALSALGGCRIVREDGGFKIIEVVRE